MTAQDPAPAVGPAPSPDASRDRIEIAAPSASPPHARRTSLLGPAFWALIGFGVICILGGVSFASFAPKLWPVARPAAPPAPAPATAAPSLGTLDARLADIQARLGGAPAPSAASATDAPTIQVAALEARLRRLEGGQQHALQAAAAALAVAGLEQAAGASTPFSDELAAAERVMPSSPDLIRLRAVARTGAPTRAVLAAEFPDVAARAVAAGQTVPANEDFLARLRRLLSSIIVVRHVGRLDGQSVDAIVARAERHADDGDLTGALAELNTLPPGARAAVADWRSRAQARADVDQRLADVRAAALRALAQAQAGDAGAQP